MKKMIEYYDSPALGCKIGRAYQMMLSSLAKALREAELNVTTSEYLVLRAVYSCPGIQQCEIAELIGKDKAAICRCVAVLEKKGLLITKQRSYKCSKVFPTKQARDIEPLIMEVAEKQHQSLRNLTTSAELEVFNHILDKIISLK